MLPPRWPLRFHPRLLALNDLLERSQLFIIVTAISDIITYSAGTCLLRFQRAATMADCEQLLRSLDKDEQDQCPRPPSGFGNPEGYSFIKQPSVIGCMSASIGTPFAGFGLDSRESVSSTVLTTGKRFILDYQTAYASMLRQ